MIKGSIQVDITIINIYASTIGAPQYVRQMLTSMKGEINSNTIIMGDYIPLQRRQWHPTPVLLPGKFHGWRSLVGCSPWGRQESDTTERLPFHFSLSCIGEGNGNPLQCSCLESQGRGSLVGCLLWGRTESDTTEATQQHIPLTLKDRSTKHKISKET